MTQVPTARRARCGSTAGSRYTIPQIKEVLAGMGLHLGMEVVNWPPDNVEELAKRFEDQY